jgi:hypothetical protein
MKMGKAGFPRPGQGLGVHECEHQHLTARGIQGDCRNQALVIEFGRENRSGFPVCIGKFGHRLASLRIG